MEVPNTNMSRKDEAIYDIIQASGEHHIVNLATQVYDLRETNRYLLEMVKQLETQLAEADVLISLIAEESELEHDRQKQRLDHIAYLRRAQGE